MKKLIVALLVACSAAFARADEAAPASPEPAEAAVEAAAPDLSDMEAAKAYVEAYADNVQSDPAFKAHEAEALATIRTENRFFGSPWALLPPLLAILLALITKEVYSSLFVGIVAGGVLYSQGSF